MSLLSSFIVSNVIKALEAEFISHVPELQQALLNEVSNIINAMADWVESKMNVKQGASSDGKKES